MRRTVLPFILLAANAGSADAHLVTTGLGPLYDGIGHLVLSPEDWAPVVALGLYVGLRGAAAARLSLFALPLALLAGGALGLTTSFVLALPAAPVMFLVLGLLVAADCHLSARFVVAVATVLGIVQGLLDGIAMRPPGGGILSLLGSAATAGVILALVAGFTVSLTARWARIVVRVMGSWIAAIGLLMLGWWLRKH